MHVPLDSEISDYLLMHDKGRRQEVLRSLLKIGFSTLVKHKETKAAVADGFDPEAMLSLLTHIGVMGGLPVAQAKVQNHNNDREEALGKSFINKSLVDGSSVSTTKETVVSDNPTGYISKEQIDRDSGGVTYMSDEIPGVADFDLDEEVIDPFAVLAQMQ